MTEQLSQTPEATDVHLPGEAQGELAEQVADTTSGSPARLVPVAESIKYRRRAQQAEGRLAQVEQQLEDLQTQLAASQEQLAGLESQRQQAQQQAQATENRLAAERMLSRAGVVDLETASLLLGKRVNLDQTADTQVLTQHIEQLLQDKPYLKATPPALPPKTASAKPAQSGMSAMLGQMAQRAIRSGDRRDVADYLRLRRQAASKP
jgi:DNA repair exonuclease SbcCD ATPase subunit